MPTLIPRGAKVTPLRDKLADLNAGDMSGPWFENAARVLRGREGGEYGYLLYKLVGRLGSECTSVILDIGTARGLSAITMARGLLDANSSGRVFSVDVLEHHRPLVWHSGVHDAEEPLAGVSISRSQIWSQWFADEASCITPILGRSHEVLKDWNFGAIDVAFVDGEHTYNAVVRDLALLEQLMTPRGIIILDDYHTGVTMGSFRSRPLNGAVRLVGLAAAHVWPPMREKLRLGTGNEFLIIKRRYAGVYKAVSEFLSMRNSEWAIEIITMPPEGYHNEGDYSLALLTRRNTAGA